MTMISPKPSPNFGQWRQAVVRQHGNRNKAVTKQAELNSQLREERTTNDDQRDGCTARLHGTQYRPFCTCER